MHKCLWIPRITVLGDCDCSHLMSTSGTDRKRNKLWHTVYTYTSALPHDISKWASLQQYLTSDESQVVKSDSLSSLYLQDTFFFKESQLWVFLNRTLTLIIAPTHWTSPFVYHALFSRRNQGFKDVCLRHLKKDLDAWKVNAPSQRAHKVSNTEYVSVAYHSNVIF